MILSAAMLLDWRGRHDANPALSAAAALLIEQAVEQVLDNPATRTLVETGDTRNIDEEHAGLIGDPSP